MYCSNCGTQMADDAKFCPNCGKGVGTQPQTGGSYTGSRVVYTEKSAGLAVVLSLLLPGAGQMYAGKIVRGIAMLVLSIFAYFLLLVPLIFINVSSGAVLGATIAVLVLLVVWYIFVIYDAYRLTKEYNEKLRMNGQPPW